MAASSRKKSRTDGATCQTILGSRRGSIDSMKLRSGRRLDARHRPGAGALERCVDETVEQWGRARRARLELRVELAGDEPGMIRQLDDLDQPPLLERSRHDEASVDQLLSIAVVDLVTVAVRLEDHRLPVGL